MKDILKKFDYGERLFKMLIHILYFLALSKSFPHEIVYVENATVKEIFNDLSGIIAGTLGILVYIVILPFVIFIYCFKKSCCCFRKTNHRKSYEIQRPLMDHY